MPKKRQALASAMPGTKFFPTSRAPSIEDGVALHRAGQLDQAEAIYRRLMSTKSSLDNAPHLLGLIARQRGDLRGAIDLIGQAISHSPKIATFHANLAVALKEAGAVDASLRSSASALELGLDAQSKAVFAQCVADIEFHEEFPSLRPWMAKALREPWARPGSLALCSYSLLRTDPAIAAAIARARAAWPAPIAEAELWGPAGIGHAGADELLLALLDATVIPSLEAELFLTQARRAALDSALAGALEPAGLAFHCALAQQCFLNEYAFEASPDNEAAYAALAARVESLALQDASWDLGALAVLAAHRPLSTLRCAPALAAMAFPEPFAAVARRQLTEPAREMAIQATLPTLAHVEGSVSAAVRAQYEANPYPRWSRTFVPPSPLPLRGAIEASLGLPITQAPACRPRVLIAGCGTGLQSVEMASRHPDADFFAIDLSLASLAYAQRQAEAMGLPNVRHAQADISRLDERSLAPWGTSFDHIESVGVLHHMADPLAGWARLVALLAPGGTMKIGLYSARARESISEARRWISRQGLSSDIASLRQARRLIADATDLREPFPGAATLPRLLDFYALSEFRDLACHVHEQTFDLARIESMAKELGFELFGFTLPERVLLSSMAALPPPALRSDWGAWRAFEEANPRAFVGMYQFHVRKIAPQKEGP